MNDERAALDQLLEVMHEHDLDALRLRIGETTYELVRRAERSSAAPPQASESAVPAAVPAPPPPVAHNYRKVTAPIVGVFYRSSAPGADAFVDVGDRVEVGQVLCILEAMKLMNEITSDFAGIVRRVLPENGALVSLGEEMFWIEP
ncbi:MAG: acetyl-CoA carboxylase biotin carboxyl carrier protein [Candidatus Eremiobacteraeota bacterium]|nr:acetyl-CoA carboxylase biotin carboxyl carrier protein [Candidatus Eremiobacteraeota bacterium]